MEHGHQQEGNTIDSKDITGPINHIEIADGEEKQTALDQAELETWIFSLRFRIERDSDAR